MSYLCTPGPLRSNRNSQDKGGPHLKQRGITVGTRRVTIHVGTERVKADLELCPILGLQLASQAFGRLCQLPGAPLNWPASATQPETPALGNRAASQRLGEGHSLWRKSLFHMSHRAICSYGMHAPNSGLHTPLSSSLYLQGCGWSRPSFSVTIKWT